MLQREADTGADRRVRYRLARWMVLALLLWGATSVVVALRGGAPESIASFGPVPMLQEVPRPAEIVSRDPSKGGGPFTRGAERPRISNRGDVVLFQPARNVSSFDDVALTHTRDRVGNVTDVAIMPLGNGSISDDGCVVAAATEQLFSVPVVTLFTVNRCSAEPVVTDVFSDSFRSDPSSPSLNDEGDMIAFSTPDELTIWRAGQPEISVAPPLSGLSFGEVALSSDGSTVAVVAGVLGEFGSFNSLTANVWLYPIVGDGVGAPALASIIPGGGPPDTTVPTDAALGRSFSPSISSDGSVVGFSSASSLTTPGAHIYDRNANDVRLVAPFGGRPHLSRDGRHVTFEIFDNDQADVYVVSSFDRWLTTTPLEVVSYPLGSLGPAQSLSLAPVVSQHGRWVSWEGRDPHLFVDDPLFPDTLTGFEDDVVFVRERRPVLTVESIDFGSVTSSVTSTATVQNVGPSGWRVTNIVATGDFEVLGENCPDVLHPQASCTVDVRFNASAVGPASGELLVVDTSFKGRELQASGRLTGDLLPPPAPNFGLEFTPNPVDFGEVPPGQPASNRVATLRNIGDASLTVGAVSLGGPNVADFSIIAGQDLCSGVILPVNGTCTVGLGFVPSIAGGRAASLSASGSAGASASVNLIGTGERFVIVVPTVPTTTTTTLPQFDPVLSALPGSVRGGEVVAVSGVGYPPSTTIQLVLAGADPIPVATDGAGAFSVQWLILEGTPHGMYTVDDVAGANYNAASVQVQVVASPVRPQGVPRNPRQDRTHVSR